MASQRDEWTVEEIQARAAEAGLNLTEEDARRLQVPVQRIRAMAREVRAGITLDVEPLPAQVAPLPASARPDHR